MVDSVEMDAALRVLRKEISSMDHKYNVARGSPPLSSPTAPRIDDLQRKKLEASVGSSFHRSPIFDSPDSPPRLDAPRSHARTLVGAAASEPALRTVTGVPGSPPRPLETPPRSRGWAAGGSVERSLQSALDSTTPTRGASFFSERHGGLASPDHTPQQPAPPSDEFSGDGRPRQRWSPSVASMTAQHQHATSLSSTPPSLLEEADMHKMVARLEELFGPEHVADYFADQAELSVSADDDWQRYHPLSSLDLPSTDDENEAVYETEVPPYGKPYTPYSDAPGRTPRGISPPREKRRGKRKGGNDNLRRRSARKEREVWRQPYRVRGLWQRYPLLKVPVLRGAEGKECGSGATENTSPGKVRLRTLRTAGS